jgi:hypothetical protein
MTNEHPTQKQLSYLVSLGVKVKPKTKDEASSLIEKALKVAPPAQYQIEYLKKLRHAKPVETFEKARRAIRDYEYLVTHQLGQYYPLFETRIIPYSIVRDIVVALRNSELWGLISSEQVIKADELNGILEKAIDPEIVKLLKTKSTRAIDRIEEKFSVSQEYIEGYLSAHGKSIKRQELEEIAFDACAQGLGGKMSSAFNSCDDDEDAIFKRDNKLNQSLKSLLMQYGVSIGTGCIFMALLGTGIVSITSFFFIYIT